MKLSRPDQYNVQFWKSTTSATLSLMNAETATAAIEERSLSDDDKGRIRAVFERIRTRMPGFTARRSQNRMIASVANALGNEGGIAVIEAPTGCGKSLGYLVPAVPIALEHELKLVISTGTIALQEQLLRELPGFLETAGLDATFALAKGRGRYVCPRNLLEAHAGGKQSTLGFEDEVAQPLDPGDKQSVQSLVEALQSGRWTGDLDNAPTPVSEELHPVITTTAGGCTGRRCSQVNNCPLMVAREEVRNADIVLSNHDLTLLDIKLQSEREDGSAIIGEPENTLFVIDEAHHWPTKAIEAGQSMVVLPASIRRLGKVGAMLATPFNLTGDRLIAGWDQERVKEAVTTVSTLQQALLKLIEQSWTPETDEREPVWRAPLGKLPEDWVHLARDLNTATTQLVAWVAAARKAAGATPAGKLRDKALRDLGLFAERMTRQREHWFSWATPDPEHVAPTARWISLLGGEHLCVHASPTQAADFLQHLFWPQAAGVVMTSATLSAGGDFSGLSRNAALPGNTVFESLESPFDLERQAVLQVPRFPVAPDNSRHAEEIARWLDRNLDWRQGSLVLFTSRAKMRAVAENLPLQRRERVKVQGDKGKAALLADHASDVQAGKGSVLFGLASFGEGLDLPGELCQSVIVTQLPFARPNEPVTATLSEWMESEGMNPFLEMTVPDALRVLTQYAGRLIRRQEDTGRIVLLDTRIKTKGYGQTFLRGLPPFRREIER